MKNSCVNTDAPDFIKTKTSGHIRSGRSCYNDIGWFQYPTLISKQVIQAKSQPKNSELNYTVNGLNCVYIIFHPTETV